MSDSDPTGQNWTDAEIDIIVADYFDMLRLELARESFVKAHRNAELQRLTKRSRGSIEFKHQNISAVLLRLGLPWIDGYKPMPNFQGALIDGIGRYLSENGGRQFIPISHPVGAETRRHELREATALFIDAPPQLSSKDVETPRSLERLVRKFDPAERDARNRSLGKEGEERVVSHEKSRLSQFGRDDLAKQVRWISEEEGDGAGFDILSFTNDGRERCLEVKTTVGHLTTPFYLTENERAFSAERPDAFRIMRLYDFARVPRTFELSPPLESCLILQPTNYRASFES